MTWKCVASGETVCKVINFNAFECYSGVKGLFQKAVEKENSFWDGLLECPPPRTLEMLTLNTFV